MPLAKPRAYLPNWAVATILAGRTRGSVGVRRGSSKADTMVKTTVIRGSSQGALSKEMIKAAFTKNKRLPTPYEDRLYQMCSAIPHGKVSTYGAMAKALQSSPRAVGQALRRNPFAPEVPCHRVVAANLELGGFDGDWGLHTAKVKSKRALLVEEGVQFSGTRIKASCVLDADELLAIAAPTNR
ncbi:g13441 [Coccomyxa viridis]|uniref:Methylated-DNA--protein-cysteine methyltransferase n=1 Tax=Coccomyxa viridis TaxID=1274662 RepID=A0ABP1GDP7_9CHLO